MDLYRVIAGRVYVQPSDQTKANVQAQACLDRVDHKETKK